MAWSGSMVAPSRWEAMAKRRDDERPVHDVSIDGFFIDVNEVTNGQFKAFVDATNYVTTAERPVDWEQLKQQLPPALRSHQTRCAPGSLVFVQPDHAVDLNNPAMWWQWTTDANWKRPKGPGSNIDDILDHPVVHVSHEDAQAYCQWANRRLPTEAQWEFAHEEDLSRRSIPGEMIPSNQGTPPFGRAGSRSRTAWRMAPDRLVGSYPANGYGLHDMAGNVREWCQDRYHPDTYRLRVKPEVAIGNQPGPTSHSIPERLTPPIQESIAGARSSAMPLLRQLPAQRKDVDDTRHRHVPSGFRTVATSDMLAKTKAPSQLKRSEPIHEVSIVRNPEANSLQPSRRFEAPIYD